MNEEKFRLTKDKDTSSIIISILPNTLDETIFNVNKKLHYFLDNGVSVYIHSLSRFIEKNKFVSNYLSSYIEYFLQNRFKYDIIILDCKKEILEYLNNEKIFYYLIYLPKELKKYYVYLCRETGMYNYRELKTIKKSFDIMVKNFDSMHFPEKIYIDTKINDILLKNIYEERNYKIWKEQNMQL